jgi:hypothetical protein
MQTPDGAPYTYDFESASRMWYDYDNVKVFIKKDGSDILIPVDPP